MTAGNVSICNRCMLGINATVIQELHISGDIIVGADAVVTRALKQKGTYVGIPAKFMKMYGE